MHHPIASANGIDNDPPPRIQANNPITIERGKCSKIKRPNKTRSIAAIEYLFVDDIYRL